MRSAVPAVIIACAATLLLGGCVPQEPVVVPPVEQQSEPVFASDEEALAAATEAYKAYLEMSDLIAQEGGKDPERIAPFVTEEWLEQELLWSAKLANSGKKLVGWQSLGTTVLQQYSADLDATRVVIYACVQSDQIRMEDANGTDVTPSDLGGPSTQQVSFMSAGEHLLLEESELWSGESVC